MTLRYKIANWLTGNALRSMAEDVEDLGVSLSNTMLTCMNLQCEIDALQGRIDALSVSSGALTLLNQEQQSRLDTIAALETAGANGTVKKMARIARGDMPVTVKS